MQIRETLERIAVCASNRNVELSIVMELAPGEVGTEERERSIADASPMPQIELRSTGDAEYFPVGVKHRYTR